MATISDIASYAVVDENITANVGDTNLTIITTDFHAVEVVEVSAPADVAIVDIGVVGLGSSGGGSGAVDSVNGETGVVVLNQDEVLDGTTHKQFSATEQTKLAGIATGATANDTDANLKARANHTGTQAISTVTGLQTAIDAKADASALTSHTGNTSNPHSVTKAQVGLGNVDNTADTAKPVSTAQQTALDLKADAAATTSALAGKQASDQDLTDIAALTPTNNDVLQRKTGAWVNRTPAQLKTDLSLTKTDVGLANVDNTADTAKPVSTAQQTALDGKQALDSDLTAIAAIAPSNDDVIQRKSGAWTNRTMAQVKTDLALTKSDVGLSNVDNTADSAKPVSTAQQTALDARFVWADGTTSTNARPSTSSKVIWVGGTTQPVNMATGDLWIKA